MKITIHYRRAYSDIVSTYAKIDDEDLAFFIQSQEGALPYLSRREVIFLVDPDDFEEYLNYLLSETEWNGKYVLERTSDLEVM